MNPDEIKTEENFGSENLFQLDESLDQHYSSVASWVEVNFSVRSYVLNEVKGDL